MIRERRFAAAATLVLALALTTACAPDPAPTPSPTGFASQEEAFAAAEATYRAYVDALNAVDLSDPATFEPVYSLLSGTALADSKKSLTAFHAEGYTRTGDTRFDRLTVTGSDLAAGTVTVALCLDVSDVDLVDSSGESVVAPGRVNVQPLDVTLVKSSNTTRIDRSVAAEELTCG